MSSDSDVAKLLQEYKAVDILTEVISKSDAPRATVSSPSYCVIFVFAFLEGEC